jgi:hypothetical protein
MPQWEEGDNRVKFISSLGAKHPFTTLAIVPAASIKWNSDIIFLVWPKEATLPRTRSQKGALALQTTKVADLELFVQHYFKEK